MLEQVIDKDVNESYSNPDDNTLVTALYDNSKNTVYVAVTDLITGNLTKYYPLYALSGIDSISSSDENIKLWNHDRYTNSADVYVYKVENGKSLPAGVRFDNSNLLSKKLLLLNDIANFDIEGFAKEKIPDFSSEKEDMEAMYEEVIDFLPISSQ